LVRPNQTGLKTLFGTVNREIFPKVIEESPGKLRAAFWATTECSPLDSTAFILPGLGHRIWTIRHPGVQRSAGSVVTIKKKRSSGSGVIVAKDFVLTARHVLSETQHELGGKKFKVKVNTLLGEIETEVEVVEFDWEKAYPPDLILLYVPGLPVGIEPVPIRSENLSSDLVDIDHLRYAVSWQNKSCRIQRRTFSSCPKSSS